MPEGDTIHKSARRLREALAGRRVARVEFRRDPRGHRPPEPGTEITDVIARGKHLFVEFGDGTTLHTHMQLTGRWDVYARGERWRRPGHQARVVLTMDDGTQAVCFNAPVVELRSADEKLPPTRAARSLDALGPDLSRDAPDLDVMLTRMDALDPSTQLGDALLDQRIAAGVGNVFKSEVCWACRVHPFSPIRAVDGPTRRTIAETAHRMLRANVDTTRRVTYGNRLAVYRHRGEPCPRCNAVIRSSYEGDDERVTFWCPSCQPAPAGADG